MSNDPFPPEPSLPPPPRREYGPPSEPPPLAPIQRAQWITWWLIIGGMVLSCVTWMSMSDTRQFLSTGIYFVLIPGTMAAILAILPNYDGGTYGVTRGVSIVVLSTALLVREGFICVLMATPIVILVVLAIVGLVRLMSKGSSALLIPLLLVGFGSEGLAWDVDRDISAAEHRVIAASTDEVWDALEAPPTLPEIEPLLFALPFPRPVAVTSSGGDLGDVRQVRFDSGGILELTVAERGGNHVEWHVTDNTTPMAGWMTLHSIHTAWIDTGDGTELAVTIKADRKLAPGFYFEPLQRFGVGEMAEVIADMIEADLDAAA